MAAKEEKKELKKLIQKYKASSGALSSFGISGGISGTALATGIGIDLMVTGGLGTAGTVLGSIAFGVYSAWGTYSVIYDLKGKVEKTHNAGQKIETISAVHDTLKKMESKLAQSFNTAANTNASQQDKENFLTLDQEIKEDIKKLFPFITISSTGSHELGHDQYIFTVKEEFTGLAQKKYLYSPEAVEQIKKELAAPVQRENKATKENTQPKGGFRL